jgi:hypothetical protein
MKRNLKNLIQRRPVHTFEHLAGASDAWKTRQRFGNGGSAIWTPGCTAAAGKWRVVVFPRQSCLVGAAKPPEEKGVEVSPAAEQRAEVSERQLDFACLIFLYRARCRGYQISSVLGRNFAPWEKISARYYRASAGEMYFGAGALN